MRSRGFTLVEILVVLLIITVVISLTVLTVTSTGEGAELPTDAGHLAAR